MVEESQTTMNKFKLKFAIGEENIPTTAHSIINLFGFMGFKYNTSNILKELIEISNVDKDSPCFVIFFHPKGDPEIAKNELNEIIENLKQKQIIPAGFAPQHTLEVKGQQINMKLKSPFLNAIVQQTALIRQQHFQQSDSSFLLGNSEFSLENASSIGQILLKILNNEPFLRDLLKGFRFQMSGEIDRQTARNYFSLLQNTISLMIGEQWKLIFGPMLLLEQINFQLVFDSPDQLSQEFQQKMDAFVIPGNQFLETVGSVSHSQQIAQTIKVISDLIDWLFKNMNGPFEVFYVYDEQAGLLKFQLPDLESAWNLVYAAINKSVNKNLSDG